MEEKTLTKRHAFWRFLVDNKAVLGTIIFWVYNLTFLAFIGFGFAPVVLPSVIQGVRIGMIPGFYAAFGIILISIPLITTILGITVFRKDTSKLFLLGYGIEGPLMLVLAVRFFGLGQTTMPVKIIMGVAIIGMATLLWHLLDREPFDQKGWQGYLKSFGLACLIAIGFYASIWVLFYAVPIGRFFITGIVEFFLNIPEFLRYIGEDLLSALADGVQFFLFLIFGGLLFAFTGTLFILLPLIVPWLYIKAWIQGNQGIGRIPAFGVLVATFALIGLSLFAVDRQPQAQAFALLENNPATIVEARDILGQSDQIRAGLLNSYLARTRYLSALHEIDHIRWMYEDAFKLSATSSGFPLQVQNAYEVVARPFLYHPVDALEPAATANQRWQQGSSLTTEPERAAELYEKFFDEPINEGEKKEVVRAVRTTWDPVLAQAAWQAVDDREVLLEEQTLNHTDLSNGVHGFELHEVYSNQTATRQEVVYYFSLPETAVITGVWLGDETGKLFDYRVAPRGAAQQVYQEQVQRRVDPALVEQIGPSQYRLRVFPIDPLSERWHSDDFTPTIDPGEDMHMWLEWQVLEQDGVIPMPTLSVLRNVYWDDESVRTMPSGATADAERWLPASMPSPAPQMADHIVTFPDGRIVIAQASNALAPQLASNQNFAIVLDRSFSMGEQTSEVEATLGALEKLSPSADVYLTASAFRGEAPSVKKLNGITADDLVYFGGQNSAEIMQQFAELNLAADYDAIIVITDDGTFSTMANQVETVAIPDSPVWMLHLGGVLPNGYDDNTLEIVQASGGGAADSIEEILTRLSVSQSGQDTDIIDGYRWAVYPLGSNLDLPANTVTHSSDDPFAKIAARQLILAEMRASKGSITDVALLDGLHEIAVDQAIVTPFSSMIVLVNEAQQKRLDDLEGKEDRFDREVEEVGETAPGPTVTGVPEPEEWLLIILATAMLGWFLWNKRRPMQTVYG